MAVERTRAEREAAQEALATADEQIRAREEANREADALLAAQ